MGIEGFIDCFGSETSAAYHRPWQAISTHRQLHTQLQKGHRDRRSGAIHGSLPTHDLIAALESALRQSGTV